MGNYTTRTFTWGTGATATTGATGASNPVHAPGGLKAVQAYLGAAGGSATLSVYGSLFDGLNGQTSGGPFGTLIGSTSLSGANGMGVVTDTDAYSTLWLNLTALSGTGAALTAAVRSIKA